MEINLERVEDMLTKSTFAFAQIKKNPEANTYNAELLSDAVVCLEKAAYSLRNELRAVRRELNDAIE